MFPRKVPGPRSTTREYAQQLDVGERYTTIWSMAVGTQGREALSTAFKVSS
jgi:hypothetical protein